MPDGLDYLGIAGIPGAKGIPQCRPPALTPGPVTDGPDAPF
ncbi:MAG TPA: hypothetical protein VND67_01455 [Acidimicrobiales bacterium]|nr:hypothetical protein [Acidimicrobiales bacterium]